MLRLDYLAGLNVNCFGPEQGGGVRAVGAQARTQHLLLRAPPAPGRPRTLLAACPHRLPPGTAGLGRLSECHTAGTRGQAQNQGQCEHKPRSHTDRHTCTHAHAHTRTHPSTRARMHHMPAHSHTQTHTHPHTCTTYMHIHTRTFARMHTHPFTRACITYMHTHVHAHTCILTRMHTHTCMLTHALTQILFSQQRFNAAG